ncbi:Flp pilus assembly complex ATPase component TadA, partial [Candidatus Bathyarchaeota archaeon]|nr:Flp pilus assembly complex ATPase component TadA [Candidatus Bathyarchaeota archaeon]
GTLNERIAAYFWFILEYKKSFMIVGGTGAGKTSTLNALLSLMSQNDKIVTVEEVPELSPPVTNWTQLHSRESFNFGDGPSGSISLFDLIKVSLRYRPDYVIVGEVRGEEAYVLFQALATGHGGLCTMHADSIDRVVKRLTSPPMNVSEVYIPLMNIAMYIQRVELPDKKDGLNFGRRVRTVSEIAEFDNYIEVSRWDPRKDVFNTWFKDSFILQQISTTTGMSMKEILQELDKRESFIKEIVESGVKHQSDVAEKILSYYTQQRFDKSTVVEGEAPKKSLPVKTEEQEDIMDALKEASSSVLESFVEPVTSEPAFKTLAVKKPAAKEPAPLEPVSTESPVFDAEAEFTTVEPKAVEPVAVEPTIVEPMTIEAMISDPVDIEPPTVEASIVEPMAVEVAAEEPVEAEEAKSPVDNLVTEEQETELDFATQMLWELAKDASQLALEKQSNGAAPEIKKEAD